MLNQSSVSTNTTRVPILTNSFFVKTKVLNLGPEIVGDRSVDLDETKEEKKQLRQSYCELESIKMKQ